jgi:hypothetical protein
MQSVRLYFFGIMCMAVYGWLSAGSPQPTYKIEGPTPAVEPDEVIFPVEGAASKAAPVSSQAAPVVVPVSAPVVKDASPGCDGQCCKCDHSRTPHYWHSGKWHPCRMFTPEEFDRENAKYAKVKAAPEPAAAPMHQSPLRCFGCGWPLTISDEKCDNCGNYSPWYKPQPPIPPCILPPYPLRGQAPAPAPVQQQPVTQMQFFSAPMQSGCPGGNCGVSSGRRRGRR